MIIRLLDGITDASLQTMEQADRVGVSMEQANRVCVSMEQADRVGVFIDRVRRRRICVIRRRANIKITNFLIV